MSIQRVPTTMNTCMAAAVAFAAATLINGHVMAGPTPQDLQSIQLHEFINAEMNLSNSELVQLQYTHEMGVPLDVDVMIAGKVRRLETVPYSVRSPKYKLYVSDAPNHAEEVKPGPVNTFRGFVAGETGSYVAGGLDLHGLRAKVELANGERWWIEPAAAIVDGFGPNTHVLYNESDVLPHEGTCGSNDMQLAMERVEAMQAAEAGGGAAEISLAELGCDADFQFYQDFGSSVTNVENRINLTMNVVDDQYESEVEIVHGITAIFVRTSQIYTSNEAGTLLGQFRTQWLSNHSTVPRDVAQLFTGKSIQGTTIGLAWGIGQICTTGAYCLVENFSSNFNCMTDLSAHELGHLWGAFHCDPCNTTMRSSITCANTFGTGSITSISNHRNSRTCLEGLYCDALGFNSTVEHVSNVAYGGLDHSSGTSPYSDFTAFSASVEIGEVVPITITLGNGQSDSIGGLWIDWNNDGDFNDDDEEISTSFSGSGPYTTSFNVPADAPLGDTRLRLRVQDGTATPTVSPCGSSSFGEVEDYGIRVLIAPPPANDLCADAITIGVDQVVPFSTFGSFTDGPFEPQLCDSGDGDQDVASDIWYEFTAPCGGNFTATLCGSNYDSKIAVYQGTCPIAPLEAIACNDDACGVASEVTFGGFGGTVFLIRVGGHNGERGSGTLTVSAVCLDAGACCLPDNSCELLGQLACDAAGGVSGVIGSSCSPDPCSPPDPTGACCATDGSCTVETAADCSGAGGTYQGDSAPCGGNTCDTPCEGDLDDSGDVGFGDILTLIGLWGPCPGCPEDLDGSGDIGFGDILAVIGVWGPCP